METFGSEWNVLDAFACPHLEDEVQSHPDMFPLVLSIWGPYTLSLPHAVFLHLTSPLKPLYSNLTVVLQPSGCFSASLQADKDVLGYQPSGIPQWHADSIFHGLLALREAFSQATVSF